MLKQPFANADGEKGELNFKVLALWIMLICKDKRRVKADILWQLCSKDNEKSINCKDDSVKIMFYKLLDMATKFPVEAVIQREQDTDFR